MGLLAFVLWKYGGPALGILGAAPSALLLAGFLAAVFPVFFAVFRAVALAGFFAIFLAVLLAAALVTLLVFFFLVGRRRDPIADS